MTIKICYEYKSCFSCFYLWILERVGQRGITSFNYVYDHDGMVINLCWVILKNWRGKVKINIQHNYRRERVFDKSG